MGTAALWHRGMMVAMRWDTFYICRMVYFMACIFNTLAMMTTASLFVTLIFLISSSWIGHNHLMVLLILGCSVLGISILVSFTMIMIGMEQSTTNNADRVVTFIQPSNILAAFLRFSRIGSGPLAGLLGSVTLIGEIICLYHHHNKSHTIRQSVQSHHHQPLPPSISTPHPTLLQVLFQLSTITSPPFCYCPAADQLQLSHHHHQHSSLCQY